MRWLKPAAIAGVGLAVLIVVVAGLVEPRHGEPAAEELDRRRGDPDRQRRRGPTRRPAAQNLVLPGQVQAFYDATDPRPRRRLSEALVRRHRRQGESRPGAGRHRHARTRPAARPGQGGPRHRRRQPAARRRPPPARWNGLLAQDAVSRQEAEEKNGDLAAKTALVTAAQANVERLQALEGFKRIVAPFDGVVTARNTDIGALINAGNAERSGPVHRRRRPPPAHLRAACRRTSRRRSGPARR